MEGFLKKRGKGAIASLKKRYCVVQGNEMVYYKNQGDANPTGCIDLSSCTVSLSPHLPQGIDLAVMSRTYTFQAATTPERDQWVNELRRHNKVDEVNQEAEAVVYTVVMRGSSLVLPDYMSLVDSYFTIHAKPQTDGTRFRTLVYKSEVVAQNSSPSWLPFTLDPAQLGGFDSPFDISVFDLSTNGSSTSMGVVSATLRAFMGPSPAFALPNPNTITTKVVMYGSLNVVSITPTAKTDDHSNQPIKGVTVTLSGVSLLPKPSGAPTDAYLVFKGMPKVLNSSNPNRPTIIQRTEVVLKSSNPTWQPVDFEVDVCGGIDAAITVECYDMDPNAKHDLLGTCSFSIRELVVACSPQYYLFNISKSRPGYKNSGILSIHLDSKRYTAVPTPPLSTTYAIKLCGKNLDNTETFGKSDPYFVVKGSPNVSASHPHNTAVTHRHSNCLIYKSEVVPKSQSPNWGLFKLNINLCGGLDAPLTIEVYDSDDCIARLIGTATTSLRELISKQAMLILTNIQKSGNSYAGQLVVQDATLVPQDNNPPTIHPLSYTIRCSASEVERSGILGLGHKSVPWFAVKAAPYDGAHSAIYKSEVVESTTKPSWKSFTIEISQTGGMDTPVTVELYSQESGRNEVIGSFTTSLREISLWKNQSVFAIVNPLKSRPGYKNSGLFKIEELTENYPEGQLPNIDSLSISSSGYPSTPPQTSYMPQAHSPNSIYPQPHHSPYPQQAAAYPHQAAAYPLPVPTAAYAQNAGYPPQHYPQQNTGYPYPQQNTGYPQQNAGYPPQNVGYPPQNYNYQPQQNPGYPPQNSGYPPQNYGHPQQNTGYPSQTPQTTSYAPQISVHAPHSAYPQQNASAHPSNAAHLHPHQAQHNAFAHSGTSPTSHQGNFPSAASSAVPRQNTSPQPTPQPYDATLSPYDDPYNNNNPNLSLRTSGVGLRSSGTGQYSSSPTSPGTGQSPSSPNNSNLAPPTISSLRISADNKSPKKEGASGGLALAGSIAAAVGTPFLYGIR